MFRPQLITVNCAHCGAPFQIPIFSIIDAQQSPELKNALLSGELNAAQCPGCGRVNYIGGPLLYHDSKHDFLAVYMPMQANISNTERQKIIGDLTNALMKGLPAEERRGYMFSPTQFFELENMVRKILEMDGVTSEMLEASSRKLALLDTMIQLLDDELGFNMAVAENKTLLDREFFMLIADAIERSKARSMNEQAAALEILRERLMPVTDFGQRLLKQRQAVADLGSNPTRQQVMQAILAGDLSEVEAITVAVLPMLDYAFFQDLSKHIEEATGEAKAALEAKRDLMLTVMDTFRKLDDQAFQAASRVADALIKADDLQQTILELSSMIDERVLDVLAYEMRHAREHGAPELAERILHVLNTLQKAAADSMPPAISLIFQLVDAEYPQATKALLEKNKDLITDDFRTLLDVFMKDVKESEDYDSQTKEHLLRHLRNVATQAKLMI
jgi:hypothetical protein